MKKGKEFFSEFKTFVMRGNVMDMAVGVIVGAAFGKITSSLVNDLLMPFIGWICGTRDMTALNILVRPELKVGEEVVQEAITLGFGSFVGTIIDFVLVAFVVFALIKALNTAHDLMEKKAEAVEEVKEDPKPTTEELLADILAELKKKD